MEDSRIKESKETQRILFLKGLTKNDGIVRTKQHLLHHYLTKDIKTMYFCEGKTSVGRI